MRAQLREAGFRLAPPYGPCDMDAEVNVQRGAASVGGVFTVLGAGAARLVLTFYGGGSVIASASADFVSTDDRVDAEKVGAVVQELIESPRVRQFALAALQARTQAGKPEAAGAAGPR